MLHLKRVYNNKTLDIKFDENIEALVKWQIISWKSRFSTLIAT